MTEYAVVPVEGWHIVELAATMRQVDVDEVWAASHQNPMQALEAGFAGSAEPCTLLADGEVIAMFGVGARSLMSSRGGIPWLLCSSDINLHYKSLLLASRRYVRSIAKRYRVLTNYVDARNVPAVRLIKWMGFTVEDAAPYGPDGMDFHRFWLVEDNNDV